MGESNTPQIRFKGFTDAWEQRKFSDITFLSGEKNRENLPYESYSITNENGFIPQKEKFENGGSMRDADKRMYYIVSPQSFVYNPARINVGSIGYQNLNKSVIVSSLYEVFKTTNRVCDRLLWHWFKSPDFQRLVESLQEGGVRLYFYYDKLCHGSITLPSVQEQQKIAATLDAIDNLITLHQRKLEKLQNIKKSCLEKMFPKNDTSVPEVRFSNFADAWEQRKLGEIMDVTSVKRIHQSDWTTEGIRFLRARDIVSNFKNEEPIDFLYISREKYEKYSSISGKVEKNDILVTGVGTIGIPYLVRNLEPLYFKDGNIIWFKNSKKINGNFLYYSFVGTTIQNFIKDSAGVGTVGTYTIESGKRTPIFLPSNHEQQKIGGFFRNLDNLITLHQRKLEKLQNIKKSCLEKMFI